MTDVINLAQVRRRKKIEAEERAGISWEDETATVEIDHDPDHPNSPILRTETAGFTVTVPLTPEEARVFAYRLLNIANAPRGVVLRGHANGDDS